MRRFIFTSFLATTCLWAGANEYFQAFPAFRDSEDWAGIVQLGEKTLQDQVSSRDAMQVHAQLASTYFYRGDFENAESHALACLTLARDSEKEIHALYLLSATARASEDFGNAKQYALLALEKGCAGALRAKVLFNLGAAEADNPSGDWTAAQRSYEEAFELFTCSEDRSRTAIRLGKVYLLKGDSKKARDLVLGCLPNIESERIQSQAEYLLAQIEQADGDKDEAKRFAEQALSRAQNLMARKDCERIKLFLDNL